MNSIEILKALNNPKDWATFVLGLVVGVVSTTGAVVGAKSLLNLDLVAKGSYFSPEQVNSLFIPKQIIEQAYIGRDQVAKEYIHRSEIGSNYLAVTDVRDQYVRKDSVTAQEATCPGADLKRYMLRSELVNYMSKNDVEKAYVLKGTCAQEVLAHQRVNKNFSLRLNDQVSLPTAGIALRGEVPPSGDVALHVWLVGTKDYSIYSAPHFAEYEYSGRRFVLKVLSKSDGVFRISLTED